MFFSFQYTEIDSSSYQSVMWVNPAVGGALGGAMS